MKNFILGIGAQKAGTTWLHGYIAASPHYRTGRVREKEMHIWDANEIPEQAATRKTLLQLRRVSHYYAWRMRRSPDFYFDYFAKLLAGGGIAADITPSYSGLSGETLAGIRDGITARGMAFRGVFLMRDPVGRCVSGFNMNRTRRMGGQASAEGVTDAGDIDAAFVAYVESDHCRFRTRYEDVLARTDAIFAEDQFFTALYEEMFDPAPLKALSGFVGVEYAPAMVTEKANVGGKKYDIGDEALAHCARVYRDTYEAMAARYPSTRDLWAGRRFL